MKSTIGLEFLKSTFVKDGHFLPTEKVIYWLKEQNEKVKVNVTQTTFKDLTNWSFNSDKGKIQHDSGKFFSIDGTRIKTNYGTKNSWDQPIINQPEIGYLGFIVKYFNGVLHFLLQAKIEPGNMNHVQLSPTLQATKSNYMQVHKGKVPLYLEYFKNAKPNQILTDQLQSEQGARFLKKRNRNIIILVEEVIETHENFVWLTLGQIKDLMLIDNVVNMDTRTVISGISYGDYSKEVISFFNTIHFNSDDVESIGSKFLRSALEAKKSFHSLDNITAFLTKHKSTFDLEVTNISLDKLNDWIFSSSELKHESGKYFKVIAVDVEIGNREVVKWSQPMVQPMQEGLCAFVCKEIDGIIHFAVQAKLECGNHDIIEFAPTVQCLTGNYRDTKSGTLPFLDYVLNTDKKSIIFDTLQSEEGGRFYKEQNRNIIILADAEFSEELPDNFIWMTLNQMFIFLKFNNFFNIQARSLIAAIKFS